MKILLIGNLSLNSGGPANVIDDLKKNISDGNNYKIETLGISKYNYFFLIFKILFSKKFKKKLLEYDLIHFHELWNLIIILLCMKAQHFGVPYIFTFHGVLNKWSMGQNRLKKKFFLFLFSRFILNLSQAFHFLNAAEYEEALNVSKKFVKRSFILSNGIKIPTNNKKMRILKNEKIHLLFFGRKHQKKGILNLINAFKYIREDKLNIQLRIVGPKSEHDDYLISKIKELKLNNFIKLEKEVYFYKKKLELFSEIDYFILPSYDEADSIALKESISFGVPVLITKECKFVIPEKFNLGFTITHDPYQIYKVIKNLNNFKKNYSDMSLSCKNYAKQNFDLTKTIENYKKITKEIIAGVKYSDNWL